MESHTTCYEQYVLYLLHELTYKIFLFYSYHPFLMGFISLTLPSVLCSFCVSLIFVSFGFHLQPTPTCFGQKAMLLLLLLLLFSYHPFILFLRRNHPFIHVQPIQQFQIWIYIRLENLLHHKYCCMYQFAELFAPQNLSSPVRTIFISSCTGLN